MNTTATIPQDHLDTLRTSGLTTLVHKQGSEGVIHIDPMSGLIITPQEERPDWAEELSVANTPARMMFYTDRLGADHPKMTNAFKVPELLAYEDLDWSCLKPYGEDAVTGEPIELLNADGTSDPFEAYTIEADHEHREQVLAVALGYKLLDETDLSPEVYDFLEQDGSVTSVTLDLNREEDRTPEELKALEADKARGFGEAATGTTGR